MANKTITIPHSGTMLFLKTILLLREHALTCIFDQSLQPIGLSKGEVMWDYCYSMLAVTSNRVSPDSVLPLVSYMSCNRIPWWTLRVPNTVGPAGMNGRETMGSPSVLG